MHSTSFRATALAFGLAALIAPSVASAQTFPGEATWTPLLRAGVPIGDPTGDGVNERDIVGDAANPAAYVHQDANFLYFRLRLNDTPLFNNNTFKAFGWGCVVEADNTLATYEFLAVVNGIENAGPDGEPDQVEWRWNAVTDKQDSVSEQAETLVERFARVTHARSVMAASTFGNNPDFFIEWAIPLATIRSGDAGAPGIPAATPLRFACGTSNNARDYSADPASPTSNSTSTLTGTWSDPLVCTAAGCTNPKVACDGPFGGTTPNRCVSPSAPVCLAGAGTCNACNGDNGAGTTLACQRTAAPICNKNAPLTGQCTQCSIVNQAACMGATPACDVTTGNCEACNGDRGSGATRACADAANPYCQLAGANIGACGKCLTNPDCGAGHTGPTCDMPTGACTDVDTDGDKVNDTVETALGTDPMNKDSDGDGIDDLTELTPIGGTTTGNVDTDGDGMIDARDTDTDGDGILDSVEGVTDLDGDGIPNYRDPDDDGDGILTKTEIADALAAGVSDDVDGDGKKNYYDTDADGDGKLDSVEGRADDDGDKKPNYLDSDATGMDGGADSGPGGDGGGGFDGGVIPPVEPDLGVLEGGGLSCGVTSTPASSAVLGVLAALVLGAFSRRRRNER